MAIPVAYNLRNLIVRKTTTIMTALGVALTVAVLLAVLALVNGLRTTLASSGDPLQIVVLRKGSEHLRDRSAECRERQRDPWQNSGGRRDISRIGGLIK